MSEDKEPEPLEIVGGGALVVGCFLHAMKYMHGSPKLVKLGHGKSYVDLGDVACTACQDQAWLHLQFMEPEVVHIPMREYVVAMNNVLFAEDPPEEEDHDTITLPTQGRVVGSASFSFKRTLGGVTSQTNTSSDPPRSPA